MYKQDWQNSWHSQHGLPKPFLQKGSPPNAYKKTNQQLDKRDGPFIHKYLITKEEITKTHSQVIKPTEGPCGVLLEPVAGINTF